MDETILLNYLQGECNDEEAARVETWCEEEPGNRKTLEQLYYTLFVGERIAVMNAIDTEASLDKFKSAIREKEKKAKRKSISIRWGRYATVAAAFLTGLVFAGGIAWGLLSNKLSDYEVITAAGQRAQTVLPDGSRVWLNASSKIVYHNSLWSSDRQIDLSGEAYFNVARSDVPFEISVGGSKIRVYGTRFNVKERARKAIETVLVEGKIGFKSPGHKEVRVSPGELVSYDMASADVKVKPVDVLYATAWLDGVFRYRDKPLDLVLEDISTWYGVSFESRKGLDRIEVTMNLNRTTPIDEVVSFLEKITKCKFIKERGYYIVK